jgi:hypothetical protein
MGFKLGFMVGGAVGYVLGARAGRGRYEQIRTTFNQVAGSPTVQQAAERAKGVAGGSAKKGLSLVQQGVEKAGSAVKERLHKDDDQQTMAERL